LAGINGNDGEAYNKCNKDYREPQSCPDPGICVLGAIWQLQTSRRTDRETSYCSHWPATDSAWESSG